MKCDKKKISQSVLLGCVIGLAFMGLLFAFIGHYGKYGFNLTWFLTWELPLYTFLGYALYKVVFKNLKNFF